mgnify:CR=1 FL=1
MERVGEWVSKNKLIAGLGVVGVVFLLVGAGVWYKSQPKVEVEVIKNEGVTKLVSSGKKIYVDVEGAVVKPGVYEASAEARMRDVLALAGGLNDEADREYVSQKLNLAIKVSDGSKIYIPAVGERVTVSQSSVSEEVFETSTGVNINTASQSDLETLPGIGEVRAKAIIAGRPYGAVEELLTRKIVSQSVYEKIRVEVGVY